MNKAELVALVADKVDLTKKATEEVINILFDTISETLETGEKVVISGFGTFEIRTRVARVGRNPRTGADIDIPAQKTPAFRTGKVLKDMVR
jgi:DNA-binding protein HU-beta